MNTVGDRCGTNAGYRRHSRRHEIACDACLEACRVYMRQWRARSGRVKTVRVPLDTLGALLDAAPIKLRRVVERRLSEAAMAALERASHGE